MPPNLHISLFMVFFFAVRISTSEIEVGHLTLEPSGAGFRFSLHNEQGGSAMSGSLGASLPDSIGQPTFTVCDQGAFCFSWEDVADMKVKEVNEKCTEIEWRSNKLKEVEDCIDIGSDFWFGGPEEREQHFPMRPNNSRARVPYLPGDMLQDAQQYFGGVAEPYWLNSRGGAVWVPQEQPLFYSWNEDGRGELCLSSLRALPYPVHQDDQLRFNYLLCAAQDPKEMQKYAALNLWKKPTGTPDELMMTQPIWSTWAQYKAEINESVVEQFAADILDHGFNSSQLGSTPTWMDRANKRFSV